MRKWIYGAVPLALISAGFAGLNWAFQPALGAGALLDLSIQSEAVPLDREDLAATQLGALRYVGGLALDADDPRFGGISGLLWEPECKRLLAVTDAGAWVVLEPEERGETLVGISRAYLGPVIGMDGAAATDKKAADAEEIARDTAGDVWVFYEQAHRMERHGGVSACAVESLKTPASHVRSLPTGLQWPRNGGVEAAAFVDGRLIAWSERMQGPDASHEGLMWDPELAQPVPVRWKAPKDYAPTAMEVVPPPSASIIQVGPMETPPLANGGRQTAQGSGVAGLNAHDSRDAARAGPPFGAKQEAGAKTGVLVLHRHFSPLRGATAVLTFVSADRLEAYLKAPQAHVLEGREIARFAPPVTVDNMEAMAVRQENGRTYVYVMSDDNFNFFQRTLLLKFELQPERGR